MAVEEVPEPFVVPGAVILRPEATGICGSEVEGYLGKMGTRTPPLIMGHEFAGIVVKVGEGVDKGLVGHVAAVNPLSSDGTCRLCRTGYTNLCPNRALIGIHSPGGFADYVRAPAENVYSLPESVGARIGALTEPLANGVHVVRFGLAGDPVEHAVVLGAGTFGLMCLQAAVLDGIPEVSVVEPHEARRHQALRLGAHAAYASRLVKNGSPPEYRTLRSGGTRFCDAGISRTHTARRHRPYRRVGNRYGSPEAARDRSC